MSGLAILAAVVVLKGATVHTAAGPKIADGVVVMTDGTLTAVGGPATPVPAGATVVDVTGKHLSPALVAPATLTGLIEIEAVRATVDVTEVGEINPEARPDVALNLDSESLPVARSNGVLFGLLVPRGSVVPGAASLVAFDGYTREDACVVCPAAVVLEWPEMLIDRAPGARPSVKRQEKRRDEALAKLREAFRAARAYRTAKGAEGKPGIPAHDADATFAALVPVLDGKVPLLVRASTRQQIEAVLRFVDEDLAGDPVRLVLLGAEDAPRLAERLAARKVPVILDGVQKLPRRSDDPYDAPFAIAGELARAGVPVAIGSGSGASDAALTRTLPDHAATAAAFGLDRLEALRAVTLTPARIAGAEARIGSLEAGKEADVVVWSGDPLDGTSRVTALYHAGRALDLADRHSRLWERYKARPTPAPRR